MMMVMIIVTNMMHNSSHSFHLDNHKAPVVHKIGPFCGRTGQKSESRPRKWPFLWTRWGKVPLALKKEGGLREARPRVVLRSLPVLENQQIDGFRLYVNLVDILQPYPELVTGGLVRIQLNDDAIDITGLEIMGNGIFDGIVTARIP